MQVIQLADQVQSRRDAVRRTGIVKLVLGRRTSLVMTQRTTNADFQLSCTQSCRSISVEYHRVSQSAQ
jgi:hypothetical protein